MSTIGVNKVILIGNLGKDPDIRVMQNGKEMASFSIATSESWIDKTSGIRTEKTEWHNIVVFNEGLIKIIKNCIRKGSKIYIEGSLRTRKWTDQNNIDRYTTEVILQGFNSALYMLDAKNNTTDSNVIPDDYIDKSLNKENFQDSNCDDIIIDDEIPF
ncbi:MULTISPECIES: single-stranded DNA-binding protein [Ehrlichia]|uniref:Single-stranded DNA-binding protein n=1 Tax=Ehrlichia cf. muris str. EmCRT TaxID=1359167 RepID=A0A0F3NG51_9RICK|nr:MULTISPECIES: single-stranded DNA-binding protein [Ehrlichia]KJV65879.1 single-stranded DNA-binding family protein [Ehrlichia cf. muris str. EmCRT]OUC04099.1 single-stranded DNA-binding protein [Ehrlichia sp. Wisconsin_h]